MNVSFIRLSKENTTLSAAVRKSIFIGLALIILVLDQLSKWLVTEMVVKNALGQTALGFFDWLAHAPSRLPYTELRVTFFYNIVMVWNEGISFGLFNHGTGEKTSALILLVLAAVISFVLLVWMLQTKDRTQGICLALAVGGALGNIIDRMRFGAVIDFIDVHAAGYHWPAFNFADSCIVVGITFLIIHSLFFEQKSG